MKQSKVVVIGLDGATWNLIKPWAEKGELSIFKKLMENGVLGNLESTIPPVTGPAWVSFSTGKNPGKHGIFDFVKLENNSLKLHKSKDIKCQTIYEILSKKNLRNIVIGLPLSFPPDEHFKGIMFSDFLYPSKKIFPESKKKYIENYRIAANRSKRREDFLDNLIETTKSRVSVAKKVFAKEKWNFYFYLFQETDRVSHSFWKDMKEDTKMGVKAKKIFYIADEFLGWLLDRMDEKTVLFIMSDHGFTSCPYTLGLNKILMDKGFLKTKIKEKAIDETLERHLRKTLGDKERKKEINLPKPLFKIASHPVIISLSSKIFKLFFKDREINYVLSVDFENSKAFVPTSESMGIYVNMEIGGKKREYIVENIIKILKNLKYNNQKVFKKVLRKDEVYSGPFVKFAPDILLIPDGFFITSGISKAFNKFEPGAFHEQKGIFLAYGSEIRNGEIIENAKIYDLAPTILHIFGLPVPKDMDGRVLKEIFKEDSEMRKRPIEYQDVNEKKRIKKSIRELKQFKKV